MHICIKTKIERYMSSKKVYQNAHEAMQGILRDGLTILSGGFGICGIAENITEEIKNSKVKDLTVVSNNCGIDGYGLGTLLQTRQIKCHCIGKKWSDHWYWCWTNESC